MKPLHLLLSAGLAAAVVSPLAARADYSRCTKQVRAQGYFITDIDSDWDRPFDKFDVIKDGKEYDLWVNRNTCKIEQKVPDNRYKYYND
ncbi:MAG: hypothetical protein VKM97_07620 [Cyanobacteriota bacterium]|nr:hypothetical protein [Cyanobacteriota bacterium]